MVEISKKLKSGSFFHNFLSKVILKFELQKYQKWWGSIYHCFVDFSAYWAHQWKQIPTVCGVLKIGQIMYIFEKLWWKLKEPPFYGKWAQKLQNFR